MPLYLEAAMERLKRYLVRCRVARGFFDSELLVMVGDSSAYVYRGSVEAVDVPERGDVDGLVSAYVIKRAGDRTLIELPGQPVVGGARTWVPSELLTATA